MASKKNVPVAMTEPSQSTAHHPEYATELPEPAAEPETAGSELTNDRDEQIRQAAYAAFERRNGEEGSPEQDWLDAEAQWERDRSRWDHAVVEVTQAFLPLLRAAPAARVVNVSSQLGSLALHTVPSSPIRDFKIPADDSSKTAVIAWTIHLAHELRDTGIKVNAIHPGYVRTDMNGGAGAGAIDLEEGARSSVAMALLDADGPTGTFTHRGQTLP